MHQKCRGLSIWPLPLLCRLRFLNCFKKRSSRHFLREASSFPLNCFRPKCVLWPRYIAHDKWVLSYWLVCGWADSHYAARISFGSIVDPWNRCASTKVLCASLRKWITQLSGASYIIIAASFERGSSFLNCSRNPRDPHRERGVNCHVIPPIDVAGFMHSTNQRTAREQVVASLYRLSTLPLHGKKSSMKKYENCRRARCAPLSECRNL